MQCDVIRTSTRMSIDRNMSLVITDRVSREDPAIGSVRLSIRASVLYCFRDISIDCPKVQRAHTTQSPFSALSGRP